MGAINNSATDNKGRHKFKFVKTAIRLCAAIQFALIVYSTIEEQIQCRLSERAACCAIPSDGQFDFEHGLFHLPPTAVCDDGPLISE